VGISSFHSVTLDESKCRGCTNCLKRCPTEAIRVHDGKAEIINEKCIDCGECIRVCAYHAKVAVTDPLVAIDKYKYKIALPAPTLYGQFKRLDSIDALLNALISIGFDDVYEVAEGADIITKSIKESIAKGETPKPVISSACPTIVRLIQVRFPELLENIVPFISPMEASARIAKKIFSEKHNVDINEIGAFFITPCPSKATAIKNPNGFDKSAVDGAISILDVYGPLSEALNKDTNDIKKRASKFGVRWALSGGEVEALKKDNSLYVDGINNVIAVLEAIEDGKLSNIDYFEGLACTGGCVGGALVFENAFIARERIKTLAKDLPESTLLREEEESELDLKLDYPLKPNEVLQLDKDMSAAIKKLELIEKITEDLPGFDCGSCGAPTCRALAEDIVNKRAAGEVDCIFKLREKVRTLAQEMIDLSYETGLDSERNDKKAKK